MTKEISVILLVALASCSWGQSSEGRSAYQQDKRYIEAWDSIKSAYHDSTVLVIPLTEKLLHRAIQDEDSTQIIQAIKYQGLAHRKIGNYVQSIDKFKTVYRYAKNTKDSLLQALSADQIGIMYTFMGNMSEAQPYVLEVAQLYSAVGSKENIANANNGLAIFYNDIGQTNKAIEIFQLALSQYEEIDDTMGRANIHANLGLLYLDEKKYDLAEKNIAMQGHLDTLMNTQWGLGFYHDFMGSLRRRQGRYEEALEWKKSSLAIREKLPSHYNRAESRSGLATTYLALGNYKEAIKNANLVLDHKEDHRSLSQQMGSYSLLSSAYEKMGDHQRSLKYHKLYMSMKDSIYNRDMISEMETKDALYEKAKQDQEIEKLNANKIIAENKLDNKNRIILIGGFAMMIISILLSFLFKLLQKYKAQKNKLSKALKEKDILLREIHHRVKNNLQIISSLLTLQGRAIDDEMAIMAINEGKNRVRSMALIHQDLYHKENLTKINVKTYMEKLIRELFDTYRIDQDRVKLKTEITNIDLDIDTVIPLGLIINELITNSLKYAFPQNREGELFIKFEEKDKKLKLSIADDGIGFDPNQIRSNSFGSTLVSALTEQLDGEMVVSNIEGTSVIISINEYKTSA